MLVLNCQYFYICFNLLISKFESKNCIQLNLLHFLFMLYHSAFSHTLCILQLLWICLIHKTYNCVSLCLIFLFKIKKGRGRIAFTWLDFRLAYCLIHMKEGHKYLCTIDICYGKFECTLMSQRLANLWFIVSSIFFYKLIVYSDKLLIDSEILSSLLSKSEQLSNASINRAIGWWLNVQEQRRGWGRLLSKSFPRNRSRLRDHVRHPQTIAHGIDTARWSH